MMIPRKSDYMAWRRARMESMEAELDACERRADDLRRQLELLYDETYEEAVADERYSDWKSRRIDL